MNTRKKTVIVAAALGLGLTLTACGSDVKTVEMPDPQPTPTEVPVTPEPDEVIVEEDTGDADVDASSQTGADPDIEVMDRFTATVPVGTLFQIPGISSEKFVDIVFTEGGELVQSPSEAPNDVEWWNPEVAPVDGGSLFYAAEVGTVKGKIRVLSTELNDDGLYEPTSEGVAFEVEVAP